MPALALLSGMTLVSLQPVVAAEKLNEVAGLVLESSGTWKITSNGRSRTVGQADVIPNEWTLQPSSKNASISVVLSDGRRFSCPGSPLCGSPIVVNKSSAEHSWLAGAITTFNDHHDVWIASISRGQTNRLNIHDSVIALKPEQVDVTQVMNSLPDGNYFLRIDPVKDGTTNEKNVHSNVISLDYKADQPAIVSVPGIKSGLYSLKLSDKEEEPSDEAWILLTTSEDYKRINNSFDAVKSTTTKWRTSVPEKMIRYIVRAYMCFLNTRRSA